MIAMTAAGAIPVIVVGILLIAWIASGSSFMHFFWAGDETGRSKEAEEARLKALRREADPRWQAANQRRRQEDEVVAAMLVRTPAAPQPTPLAPQSAPVAAAAPKGPSKRKRKAQRKVAIANAERWTAFVAEREARKAVARKEEA